MHECTITDAKTDRKIGVGWGDMAEQAINAALDDMGGEGPTGAATVTLTEDGIASLTAHGASPRQAAKAAKEMDRKARTGGGR